MPPGKGATAADLPLISRLRAAASPQGEAKARRRGCRAQQIRHCVGAGYARPAAMPKPQHSDNVAGEACLAPTIQ